MLFKDCQSDWLWWDFWIFLVTVWGIHLAYQNPDRNRKWLLTTSRILFWKSQACKHWKNMFFFFMSHLLPFSSDLGLSYLRFCNVMYIVVMLLSCVWRVFSSLGSCFSSVFRARPVVWFGWSAKHETKWNRTMTSQAGKTTLATTKSKDPKLTNRYVNVTTRLNYTSTMSQNDPFIGNSVYWLIAEFVAGFHGNSQCDYENPKESQLLGTAYSAWILFGLQNTLVAR